MPIENMIKRLQNIMRKDEGLDGDANRINQIVWILFLKIYDKKEEEWEITDGDFESVLPEHLRWRNWANNNDLTGEELITFIDTELFKTIKELEITESTARKYSILKEVFIDTYNYMKNGILLRQVIEIINELELDSYEERHAFNDIYESILKDLQSAGNAGEFYTPKSLTDWIAETINPTINPETNEQIKIGDFAVGTGGLIASCLDVLESKYEGEVFDRIKQHAIYGVEKKGLPYLLCTTKMILHGIEEPNITRGNTLEREVTSYGEAEKFDYIVMNPPYGGEELESTQRNFPLKYRTKETADLFLVEIMYRLKENGKCAVILPDSIIFGTDKAKVAIKEKLVKEFNLHTIVKVCEGAFAPYTQISTNVLFFDNTKQKTDELWIYEHKAPTKSGKYTKSKQIKKEDLNPITDWWTSRTESEIAHKVTVDQIIKNNYNLNFKS